MPLSLALLGGWGDGLKNLISGDVGMGEDHRTYGESLPEGCGSSKMGGGGGVNSYSPHEGAPQGIGKAI